MSFSVQVSGRRSQDRRRLPPKGNPCQPAQRGLLKLSNLLQLDRFEEDLNISKVKLRYPPPSSSSHCTPSDPPAPTPAQRRKLRQQAKEALARLRQQLGDNLNP